MTLDVRATIKTALVHAGTYIYIHVLTLKTWVNNAYTDSRRL